jgi:ADP-heptose:LPS heptosyltransferase
LAKAVRPFLGNLSFISRRKLERRLISRANSARDARHFAVAAALYQEALELGHADPHIRVQCGNMLKDSGHFAEAERQYKLAAHELPDNADLALQMGHLYKLAGDMQLAEAEYRRALALKPGWDEAAKELIANAGGMRPTDEAASMGVVAELLPRGKTTDPDQHLFRLFQLGRQAKGRHAATRLLRGVEAIRGYRLSPVELKEISLLIDSESVRREKLVVYRQENARGAFFKHVFNLWHDFSNVAPGPHMIELHISDAAGKIIHRHREWLEVAPIPDEATAGSSDAWIPLPVQDLGSLDEAINSMPSVIRSTERKLLPDNIRTILVQRADQLGDLACSVPALKRLRALFPQAKLVGLLTPANAALAETLDLFDDIVSVDFSEDPTEGRRVLGADAQQNLRKALARHAIDLAIDMGEGDDSRPLLLLSGARFLYGFRNRQFGYLHGGLDFGAHDPINTNDVVPPSRKFILLIEGLAALMKSEAEPLPNRDRSALADLGIATEARYALIHTGARLFFSRWPEFETLVRNMLDRTDLNIVLLSDNAAFAEQLSPQERERLHVISGLLPFKQLDALISNAAVFVGNDSGPKHLAALRGVPAVSIHIPRNNWSEWGQEGAGLIITRRVPCAGCGIAPDGTDCGKDYACIRRVTPDEVFASVMMTLPAN